MNIPEDRLVFYVIAGLASLLDRYVSPVNRVNIFNPLELKVLAELGHDYLSAAQAQNGAMPVYHRCESCLCAFGLPASSPLCSPCFFATPS